MGDGDWSYCVVIGLLDVLSEGASPDTVCFLRMYFRRFARISHAFILGLIP